MRVRDLAVDAVQHLGADPVQRGAEQVGEHGEKGAGFGGEQVDHRGRGIGQRQPGAAADIGVMGRQLPAGFLANQIDTVDHRGQEPALRLDAFGHDQRVQLSPAVEIAGFEPGAIAGDGIVEIVAGEELWPGLRQRGFAPRDQARAGFGRQVLPCGAVGQRRRRHEAGQAGRQAGEGFAEHRCFPAGIWAPGSPGDSRRHRPPRGVGRDGAALLSYMSSGFQR